MGRQVAILANQVLRLTLAFASEVYELPFGRYLFQSATNSGWKESKQYRPLEDFNIKINHAKCWRLRLNPQYNDL